MSSISYWLASNNEKKFIWNPLSLIFNERRSFSFQLMFSLSAVLVVSMLLTTGICITITIFPSNDAYSKSIASVDTQLYMSMTVTSLQIADAITQHVNVLSKSINFKSVTLASILLQNGTNIQGSNVSTIFTGGRNYYDYNFKDGCQYPTCPQDFQSLKYTKRVGAMSGSMSSTSISLYSSQIATTISSNNSLSTLLSRYPAVGAVSAALQIQDNDCKVSYNFGPGTTQFIYITAKLPSKNSSFISIHRTYPGIKQPVGYNPTNMSWFLKAPEGKLHFDTPFVNKMTSQVSFRLSTKKTVHAPKVLKSSLPMTIVGATIVSMDSITHIISNVIANTNYQAMLVNADTSEVLWFGNTTVINPSTKTLKTVKDIDLNLGTTSALLTGVGPFTYVGSTSRVSTVGLSRPFLLHWTAASKVGATGGTSRMALVLVLLQPSSTVYKYIAEVNQLATNTNTQIILVTVLIATVFTITLLLRAELFVRWFTQPLSKIIEIARKFVDIATIEGKQRSFHEIASDSAWVDESRGDEAGVLAKHFMNMVSKLHTDNENKKIKEKYPLNPFHVKGGVTTFDELRRNIVDKHAGQSASTSNLHVGHTSAHTRLFSFYNRLSKPSVASPDAHISAQLPATASSTLCLSSTKLRNYWFLLALSMLLGLIIIIIFTFLTLSSLEHSWVNGLTQQKQSILQAELFTATALQKVNVDTFLLQSKLTLLTLSSFIKNLEVDNITYSNNLTSYSMDKTSGFASRTDLSYSFSGYFKWDVAGCRSNVSCASVQNSLEVKRTSLLDLQFRSFNYDGRVFDSFQYGVNGTGLVRSFPYTRSYSSNPQSCLIEDAVTLNICEGKYTNSKCSDSTSSGFPAYDPRCSMWYTAAYSGDENSFFIQNVVNTTNGVLVIPSSTPVLSAPLAAGGHLIGVLSGQFLVQNLVDKFRKVKLAQDGSGYSFVIDVSSGTKDIVLFHPNLIVSRTYTPTRLSAIESCFSPTEYQTFLTNVVNIINAKSVSSSVIYAKCGSNWLLTYSVIPVGSRVFAVMATAPLDVINADGNNIGKEFQTTRTTSMIVFAVCDGFLFLCMLILAFTVISTVVEPLVVLRSICDKIVIGDYDFDQPHTPSSLDMKNLVDAFGNMLITLQFDSDNFARGHHDLALKEYSTSLKLYTIFGNKRRIGIAQNNLGVVEISFGDFRSAEILFNDAVANAHELKSQADSWQAIGDAQRILSNRLNNLAMAYMEQDRLSEAENLLNNAMSEDQNQSYIFGYISKQCNLGQVYLRRRKYRLALQVLTDALLFATAQNGGLFDEHWTAEDAATTEQTALRSIAMLYEEMGKKSDAEETYLKALTFCDIMNTRCTTKVLANLNTLLTNDNRKEDLIYLNNLAKQYNLRISETESTTRLVKRIGFVIQNTGAIEKKWMEEVMKGAKDIVRDLKSDDLVTVQHSDPLRTRIDFPLREKGRNLGKIYTAFDDLLTPKLHGSMFTPMLGLLNSFEQNSSQFESTVILITDSCTMVQSDERYRMIAETLSRTAVSLIVLGIGNTIARDDLETLILHARKGHFIYSYCTAENIVDAFEDVAYWVKREVYYTKGQILLEEF